ncbi:MAG TPA: terminase small subunit, partial [Polyangiaceae bacterium]|nr:terminase small subunit [Polyangiaceae bacterium]
RKDPRINAAIEKALAEQSKRTKISADRVLEEYWSIATANANELVEFRRTCCRHCHGTNFEAQHTKAEQASRRALFALRKNPLPTDVFDEQGGEGYDARRDPHAACPECFGEGIGTEFFKDSRKLSPDALRLYGGVKITKGGIEIVTHDKMSALDKLARHFGLLKDKPDDDDAAEDELEARLVAIMRAAVARKKASEGAAA